MSLKPSDDMTIPADTARVARTIFPKGDNLCIKMRDELGLIFNDEQYRELFGRRGKPGESPGRLALVTLLQFAEDLTDREAADADRTRIDWKDVVGWRSMTLVSTTARCARSQHRELARSAGSCPDNRHLLHSALVHYNLLIADDEVSAVLDWGNSLYGDFLYELAQFTFWSPWHSAMPGIDFRELTLAHYTEIGLAMPDFTERLASYELHIALNSIAYCSFTENWTQDKKVTAQAIDVARGI